MLFFGAFFFSPFPIAGFEMSFSQAGKLAKCFPSPFFFPPLGRQSFRQSTKKASSACFSSLCKTQSHFHPSDSHFPYHFFFSPDISVLLILLLGYPFANSNGTKLKQRPKIPLTFVPLSSFFCNLQQAFNNVPFPLIFSSRFIQITEIACSK